jgi:hypothetical protein
VVMGLAVAMGVVLAAVDLHVALVVAD